VIFDPIIVVILVIWVSNESAMLVHREYGGRANIPMGVGEGVDEKVWWSGLV